MAFTRITALWSGATGLPGYTRCKFDGALTSAEALAAAARVRTFFDSTKSMIPAAVNITFTEAAQHYDGAGDLQGEVSYAPPALVQGTAAGTYSAPTGMVVNWLTNTVSNGRKVRGRTFMVPLGSSAFAANGQPSAGSVGVLASAAQALVNAAPSLVIFSPERVIDIGPITIVAGVAPVTGSSVPARAAVLRSRRD